MSIGHHTKGNGFGRRFIACAIALFWSVPVWGVDLIGTPQQGGVVRGKTAPGTEVTLDGRPVPVAPDGLFLLGFGREAPATAQLRIGGRQQTLTVQRRDWQIQRIDGLPQGKVTPDPEAQARIAAENAQMAELRRHVTPTAHFTAAFLRPAEGRISGVFGSQRILNGEPRAAHSGLDIAAPTGADVQSAADGTVVLAHPDLYFTGQTVMIDHGLGLQTVYAHLSRTDVQAGQWVTAGQVIGAVGATGRATGPHLHWGVSWLDVRLDPQAVLNALGAAGVSAPPPRKTR